MKPIPMYMRAIDKNGKILGKVSVHGLYNGSLSYVTTNDKVILTNTKEVDIQCSFDNVNWQTFYFPVDNDANMMDDLRILRGA